MKKGFTLIEVIIAIALLSMCVVGFLESLNVGILGTDRVRQQNYAVELARSQMEYIKQQEYLVHNNSETSRYGNVSEVPTGFSTDDIEATVYNVSGMDNRALQEVEVNISFMGGDSYIELVDYKAPRDAGIIGEAGVGWLVTDQVNVPTLPSAFQFLWWGGEYSGYYYTFETGTTTAELGAISVMWQFTADAWFLGGIGNPAEVYIYKYEDVSSEFPSARDIVYLEPEDVPSGELVMASSQFWGVGEKEVSAIELEDQPPGKYTIFFYNPGVSILGIIGWSRTIYASTATLTYYK